MALGFRSDPAVIFWEPLIATPAEMKQRLGDHKDGSVWESNPLTAFFKPPTGFEDQQASSASSDNSSTSGDRENGLASCLALLAPKYPDLALLVERWESLPEAV